MAGACAGVGLAIAAWIVVNVSGDDYAPFLFAAPAAAFATAALFWWWLLDRPANYTRARGAVAGALAGAVAHYLCWLMLMLGTSAYHALTGGFTGSLGDAPMGPLDAFWMAAVYSLLSLYICGWLTVPAGAIIGAAVAHARRAANAQ
jgi:hypothetical protein